MKTNQSIGLNHNDLFSNSWTEMVRKCWRQWHHRTPGLSGAWSHLKICVKRNVCMCVCVNEYEGLSWWKKNLNQLRISLAPSALFVLLITVLRSAASPSKQHWAYTAKISRYENAVYILPPLTIYIPDPIFVYLSCISLLVTYLKLDTLSEVYIFPRSVQLPVIHELPGQMPPVFLLLHEIKTLPHTCILLSKHHINTFKTQHNLI